MQVISSDGAPKDLAEAYTDIEKGILMNSGPFNGKSLKDGEVAIVEELSKKGMGKKSVSYKLRDWVFSRQHYWGEPIPVIYCEKCGEVAVPEQDLPVVLPEVKHYEPTETGESPLAAIKDWVNTKCPKCDGPAKRETDTMPNWAGSNWYFCRYTDSNDDKAFADRKKLDYWLPVDLYNGGMEHTTLHLLYSRFVYKFLFDKGFVPGPEPYASRRSHGVVLAEDSRKMSKSYGNVINPDDVVEQYGADTLRLYEMFMAPFDQMVTWSSKSIVGVFRFLDRVWKLYMEKNSKAQISNDKADKEKFKELENGLNKLIKKITDDLEAMKFNTAVAAFMDFSNRMARTDTIIKQVLDTYLVLLAPFAPHISEELWHMSGREGSVHAQPWPEIKKGAIREESFSLIVQVNGKVRDRIVVKSGITKEEAEKLALASLNTQKHLEGKVPKKVIYTGKLLNFVV